MNGWVPKKEAFQALNHDGACKRSGGDTLSRTKVSRAPPSLESRNTASSLELCKDLQFEACRYLFRFKCDRIVGSKSFTFTPSGGVKHQIP